MLCSRDSKFVRRLCQMQERLCDSFALSSPGRAPTTRGNGVSSATACSCLAGLCVGLKRRLGLESSWMASLAARYRSRFPETQPDEMRVRAPALEIDGRNDERWRRRV